MAESSVSHRSSARRRSRWWRAFLPAPVNADWRERLRVVVGAGLGIALAGLLSHAFGHGAAGWPWLVAPLGASAVLVFGVPASPLAQPWAVVGGNTLSALLGIGCVAVFGSSAWTAGLAVGLAIAAMFALRCLHPPGGASALLTVMAGIGDPRFALYPVLLNSLLLTLAGIAYNHATGRAYPHMQLADSDAGEAAARDLDAATFDADLDAVLARYNQVLDVSRDDLKALLEDTQLRGYQRQLANLRCGDIMSRDLVTVDIRTPLTAARELFARHRIKALPVVDRAGGIVGIVTPADFMRAAALPAAAAAAAPRQPPAAMPATVGEIMTRQVRVASVGRHLAELIPLFGSTGHHHIRSSMATTGWSASSRRPTSSPRSPIRRRGRRRAAIAERVQCRRCKPPAVVAMPGLRKALARAANPECGSRNRRIGRFARDALCDTASMTCTSRDSPGWPASLDLVRRTAGWLRGVGARHGAALLAALLFAGSGHAAPELPLTEAAKPGRILMLRHARAPGTGDPPNFELRNCSTQRQLDAQGRAQARELGRRMAAAGLQQARVYSSQWCRCLETARLLGLTAPVELPALNSFFGRSEMRDERVRALRRFVASLPADGPPVVMVTHQVTITAFTGGFVESGAGALFELDGAGGLRFLGDIAAN